MAWYVNAYETLDVYGGPEEGGWWYTVGHPTDEWWGPFDDIGAAWDQQAELRQHEEAQNEGRWPRNSANGDWWYEVRVEDHPPKAFPEEHPRYE